MNEYGSPDRDPDQVVETTTSSVQPTVGAAVTHQRVVAGRSWARIQAERVVWLVATVILVLIGLRFAFRLFGASTDSAFVAMIYGVTGPLVAPFVGIFRTPNQGGYVFEPESLVAMGIYALLAWGIVALIRITTPSRPAVR